MAHLKTDATRAELTPREWLHFGSQMGEVVNTWANRSDLVTYVGPGAGQDAPACFNPILAEVEVNTEIAFGLGIEAGVIGDFRERATQREWPKAAGAIFHEALQQAFPNHNVDCLLLCTTEDCQYNQYAHTDNNKWACLFHEDLHKHVCQNNDGHATCRKDNITTPLTKDMCPFSVFLSCPVSGMR